MVVLSRPEDACYPGEATEFFSAVATLDKFNLVLDLRTACFIECYLWAWVSLLAERAQYLADGG
jgi:hypothetical protein